MYADVCSNILGKYFDQLCSISDLDLLLPHFVERFIISFYQLVEMIENSYSSSDDRMRMLIENVSLPLQSGVTEPFDCFIDILEHHGMDETKMMATSMKREIKCNQLCSVHYLTFSCHIVQ